MLLSGVIERFKKLPQSLVEQSRMVRLGRSGVPALLAHPDWISPRGTMIWMHGRTADKETDSGRYQRWLRAGVACCAVDLPGHGERFDREVQDPRNTLRMLRQMLGEIDEIIEALADPIYQGVFDLDRMGIGGMSAGGMTTLRRLCEDHPFVCAAVEGCTGWLAGLYADGGPWGVEHDPKLIAEMDAMSHLAGQGRHQGFRPIPLLALHAEHDQIVPIVLQQRFIERLREHYRECGADEALVKFVTFERTGAPQEHNGFGKFGNDAKNVQTEFVSRWLGQER